MVRTFFSKHTLVVLVVVAASFLVLPFFASAQDGTGGTTDPDGTGGLGAPDGTGGTTKPDGTGGVGAPNGTGGTTLQNPLSVNSFPELAQKLLQVVMMIGTPIAVFFIVLAGFKFVAAQGNTKKLGDARKNFMYTLIGIAIFVGSAILINIILDTLCAVDVRGLDQCSK